MLIGLLSAGHHCRCHCAVIVRVLLSSSVAQLTLIFSVWYLVDGRRHYKGPHSNLTGHLLEIAAADAESLPDEKAASKV
jgi:hypothetical protein